MAFSYSVLAGKIIQRIARLRGGSGSALPGLIIEKVDPKFMKRTLESLPRGVVVISGTNGKTTTTKIVVSLLESQGLKVFSNRTGSNFTRGVVAALLRDVDSSGRLEADIAVLELDEAHARHFISQVRPDYSLFLNVLRDQLDRFGEIDATAKLLHSIAAATSQGIVVNRDDPRLASQKFLSGLSVSRVDSYGVSDELHAQFPPDDELRSPEPLRQMPNRTFDSHTELIAIDKQSATINFGDKSHQVNLKLKGSYNIVNATAAIALVRMVQGSQFNVAVALGALTRVEPAFGRGETVIVNGQPTELVLVKNPSGFRLSLASFDAASAGTMIAINDNFADGRDMSWLWDVDFESLRDTGVDSVSGVRAYDMALRLQYDLVDIRQVEPNIATALADFIEQNSDRPRQIFCSYTAMLSLRRELSKIAEVEQV